MDSSSQSGGLFRQKIALLIDFDNMILGIEDPGFDIEIVVNALRERGVMVLGRAYGDWYRHSRHRRRLMEQGIDLIETPVFGPIIKNSADMHMALDAFEIAHTQTHIDTFCIVSGDSDFLPLIKRLQTRDKNVIVIAGQKFTSDLVRRNCSEYISYENLLAEAMNVHEDVTVIEGAYQLLARAVDTLHERGVEVRSSALKQMMVQLNPMFSERTFGCSQFRNFLDRAQRAGAVRMEGRDPHSGELLVSITEEYAEARAQSRVEPRDSSRDSRYDSRSDYRSDSRSYDSRSYRDSRTDNRVENRTESRERYDRFDRYEPGSNRRESPGQRDERRFARSEPLRTEPARTETPRVETPRVESRTQPREEAGTDVQDERTLTPAVDAATTADATPEAAAEATEGAAETRESRRRRGGRGRSKSEARENESVTETAGEAKADASVQEAQAAFEAGVDAAQDAAQHEDESPQVLEDASASTESTKAAPEFIDRNSQLGRTPLRRGRLRFSAKKGVTAASEALAEVPETAAPDAQDGVNHASSEADEASSALVEASTEAFEASSEAVEASTEANQASSEADEIQDEAVEASNASVEAAEVAEAPAEAPEAEAKPKKPRRRAPRKKAVAEAEATPAAEVEAPAPTPEAEVAAPAEEAPTPVAEASAADAAPDADAAPEAEAKPKKRAPRRRAPRKKATDADAPEAPPAE